MFLSANVGVGHTSAANAVRIALEEIDPGARTRIVDSYRYAASVVSRVVSNGYLGMVKTIPQMYRFLYSRAERATEVGPFRTWIHQFTASNLRPLMERERPDVVVCTHAFPCGVMAEYRRLYDDSPPIAGVVTDYAIHTYWIHDNVDAYAVATEQMRATLVHRGIRPERVHVTGIPIRSEFAQTRLMQSELRAQLGLPLDRAVVLLMGGGLGIGPLGKMLEALDRVERPICAVAIVGRSARSEHRVLERARTVRYPVRVTRFVDNVYDYMHAADVLVSKPGGLTTAEALASAVPLVLFQPLPGQEERNTRFLLKSRAALSAQDPSDLAAKVESILADGSHSQRMREAMMRIAMPDAARDVAQILLALTPARVRGGVS